MFKKILIVDDEPLFLDMLKMRLEANSYEVVTSGDGEEAIELIRKNKPDLIISDVSMPKMDGYEFCKALGNIEECKNIPLILLTAFTQAHQIKKGMDSGAVSYVQKTTDTEVLLGIIKAMIGGESE